MMFEMPHKIIQEYYIGHDWNSRMWSKLPYLSYNVVSKNVWNVNFLAEVFKQPFLAIEFNVSRIFKIPNRDRITISKT